MPRQKSFTMELKIGVAYYVTSSKWRAGTVVGGIRIFSQGTDDPVSAVQALLLKIGSGHEYTDVGIEAELSGGKLFPPVSNVALTDGEHDEN